MGCENASKNKQRLSTPEHYKRCSTEEATDV